MKHLPHVFSLVAIALLSFEATAFPQMGPTEAQKLAAQRHFAIEISLGIVDDNYIATEKRIIYPLAFRVKNVGKTVIKADDIPEIFFQGFIHVVSADGKEQQAEVQPSWRTMVYDLQPKKIFRSPDYANLLDFFPGLKNGEYQVWWTRRELKSNVLRFTVTKSKLRLHHPKA